MATLRLMQIDDLNAVNAILSKAFTQGREDDGYKVTQVPMCRPDFIEMYFQSCSDGCFVIEESDQLIACAFSHVWGKVGWIGPIAVTPRSQLQGYGKMITQKCVSYLKEKNCVTIGLETMPRSFRNLGLYAKLNFISQDITVDLMRPVSAHAPATEDKPHRVVNYSTSSESVKSAIVERARNLVKRIDPNLDYQALTRSVADYSYGDSLLMVRNRSSIAFAVVLWEPTFSTEKQGVLKVVAFTAHPDMPDTYLRFLIADFEQVARQHFLDHLLIRVPTRCQRMFKLLLHNKFRIIHSDLRMTLDGYPKVDYSKYIHLDRWE